TFTVTLRTAGSQTITATDTAASSVTGTSQPVTANAAAASHFSLTSSTGTTTAGTAFNVTVVALDQFNNTATGYGGTVPFSSRDPHPATFPSNSTLSSGTGSFSVTLFKAPSQTITVTDANVGSITGSTVSVNVTAAATSGFTVSAPASA